MALRRKDNHREGYRWHRCSCFQLQDHNVISHRMSPFCRMSISFAIIVCVTLAPPTPALATESGDSGRDMSLSYPVDEVTDKTLRRMRKKHPKLLTLFYSSWDKISTQVHGAFSALNGRLRAREGESAIPLKLSAIDCAKNRLCRHYGVTGFPPPVFIYFAESKGNGERLDGNIFLKEPELYALEDFIMNDGSMIMKGTESVDGEDGGNGEGAAERGTDKTDARKMAAFIAST